MAVIHYQFESLHPFYDGNGRAGRILNIPYLVREGLATADDFRFVRACGRCRQSAPTTGKTYSRPHNIEVMLPRRPPVNPSLIHGHKPVLPRGPYGVGFNRML